jgi:hypothetical protein
MQSFDPKYESLPLEHFEPIVKRLVITPKRRRPYRRLEVQSVRGRRAAQPLTPSDPTLMVIRAEVRAVDEISHRPDSGHAHEARPPTGDLATRVGDLLDAEHLRPTKVRRSTRRSGLDHLAETH